jgi:excinuclease UvrABC nuclease subunit
MEMATIGNRMFIDVRNNEKIDKEYNNVSGIYMIYSEKMGKIYIGSAINIYKRYKEHRNGLFSKKHSNYKMNKLFNSNSNNLYFSLIEVCLPQD